MVLQRGDYFIGIETQYYVEACAEELVITGDSKLLRRRLAAVSIENVRSDWRDAIIWLDEMRVSAGEAGIDPYPYLEEIAELSSNEVPSGSDEPLQPMIRDYIKSRQQRKGS